MSTKNFPDTELACKCGCGGLPPVPFQLELQRLRNNYGRPMVLSSGCRCPDHNVRKSKTGRNGPHTQGAVDVLVWGEAAHDLIANALAAGWTGIGVSQKGAREARFIHLDQLEGPTRPWVWSY